MEQKILKVRLCDGREVQTTGIEAEVVSDLQAGFLFCGQKEACFFYSVFVKGGIKRPAILRVWNYSYSEKEMPLLRKGDTIIVDADSMFVHFTEAGYSQFTTSVEYVSFVKKLCRDS